MGFYTDGKWQPSSMEMAAGEYAYSETYAEPPHIALPCSADVLQLVIRDYGDRCAKAARTLALKEASRICLTMESHCLPTRSDFARVLLKVANEV